MRPNWFKIYELVPKALFEKFPEAYLWGLLDDRLLALLDELRERYGPAVVNNYHNGGKFDQSGFRTDAIGATLSQHRYGRAADLKFSRVAPEEIRIDIQKGIYTPSFCTAIELGTPSWLHVDVRNHDHNGILWVPQP